MRAFPMISSVCDAGKRSWAVKLVPAALLALSILLIALYNSCPSCNSEVVWLSIYPSPASTSSSLVVDREFSRPPAFSAEPRHIFPDHKLGDDGADSAAAATTATTLNSTRIVEVLNSEQSADAVGRVDKKAQDASHSGISDIPPDRHARVSDRSDDQSPKVLRKQRRRRRHKTKALPAMPAVSNLQAHLYHNLSAFIKSYELMEKTFRIYTYGDGVPPLVHTGPTVGIYASEGRFIQQLQSSRRFSTTDPSKAQLFFLPYSITNMVLKIYVPDSHDMHPLTRFVRKYVDHIASEYPYWNRSQGADHFFVSCHDWGPATARHQADLRRNAIKVVCNADETEEFVVGKDVSLPETYLRSKPPTRLGGPPATQRPYLAFFAGQMHGRVRPILLRHWKGKDPAMKIYERIPAAIARKVSYERHMRMSRFCICAMGYEVNSPRIVEAIHYDCVPVIIADHFVLPFSDVLDWEAFSVSVAEQDVPRLRQILLSIPAAKYAALQANLKHVRQHFVWHSKLPARYDVFHMILHSLWLRQHRAVASANMSNSS